MSSSKKRPPASANDSSGVLSVERPARKKARCDRGMSSSSSPRKAFVDISNAACDVDTGEASIIDSHNIGRGACSGRERANDAAREGGPGACRGSKQENNADEDNDAVAFRPDLRSRIRRVILHAWPFLDTDNLAIDLYPYHDGPALELDIVNDDCAEHLIRRNKDVISVLHKAGIMGELACVQINVRDSSEIKKRALLLSRYDADVKAGIIPDVIGV